MPAGRDSTAGRTYWLDLFTWETWQEFLEAGGEVSGFRENRWATVQKIKVGDYLVCYLTGLSRFIGVLEVTRAAYRDERPVWKSASFPCRLGVRVVAQLTPLTAVPIKDLQESLSIFEGCDQRPFLWTGYVRGSPSKWKAADGRIVVDAVLSATDDPREQPFDERKLHRRPATIESSLGEVTVPEDEDGAEHLPPPNAAPTAHEELQALLLDLGGRLGLNVWVARNDRGRTVDGKKLGDMPRCIDSLPVQFDEATTRTIELIDVLWLKGNAIIAAFEIEHTTSVYSGILRMADLVTMQPNINLPMYIVAPAERRNKVLQEVSRPTFARLTPPLGDVCSFIAFEALREQVAEVRPWLHRMKPEFIDDIAEPCGTR